MRDIRFRGKRLDADEWVEGFLINDHAIRIYEDGYYDYEVIPSTVGQFTGLKDQNGKEIWEWDVIKRVVYPTRIIPVEFVNGAFSIVGYPARQMKVVGNIHDNAELLK